MLVILWSVLVMTYNSAESSFTKFTFLDLLSESQGFQICRSPIESIKSSYYSHSCLFTYVDTYRIDESGNTFMLAIDGSGAAHSDTGTKELVCKSRADCRL